MLRPPTLQETAVAMRTRRLQTAIAEGPTFQQIYGVIADRIGNGVPAGRPCGTFIDDFGRVHPITCPKYKLEKPVTPRPPCKEHRDKTWTAPSGNYYAACTADDCLRGQLLSTGKRRKMHSDRVDHTFDLFIDEIPTVEATDDGEGVCEVEVPELQVMTRDSRQVRIAGEDEPDEPEVEESEYEDEDELAVAAGSWSDDE